jgi:hypothetical protein
MPDEYMYLICNADDRLKSVAKLPTGKINLTKHKIAETYALDEGLSHSRAPDRWLTKIHYELYRDYARVRWEFETIERSSASKNETKKDEIELTDIEKFKLQMQNPKLFQ